MVNGPLAQRKLLTETSSKAESESNISLQVPIKWHLVGSFFMETFCLLQNGISPPSTLPQCYSAALSTPTQAVMPGVPQVLSEPEPVPILDFVSWVPTAGVSMQQGDLD